MTRGVEIMSNGKGLFLAAFVVVLSANAVVAEAAQARSTMAKAGAKIYLLENNTPTNTTAAERFQGRFNVDY
jgi:hypothetical protein